MTKLLPYSLSYVFLRLVHHRVEMSVLLLLIFSSLICKSTAFAQKQDVYSSELYPDSEHEWQLCGLTKPGLSCDPNNALTTADGQSGKNLH